MATSNSLPIDKRFCAISPMAGNPLSGLSKRDESASRSPDSAQDLPILRRETRQAQRRLQERQARRHRDDGQFDEHHCRAIQVRSRRRQKHRRSRSLRRLPRKESQAPCPETWEGIQELGQECGKEQRSFGIKQRNDETITEHTPEWRDSGYGSRTVDWGATKHLHANVNKIKRAGVLEQGEYQRRDRKQSCKADCSG